MIKDRSVEKVATVVVEKKTKSVVKKKEEWYEPCVGTYRVNYNAIDK
jgi:hypothetical protein